MKYILFLRISKETDFVSCLILQTKGASDALHLMERAVDKLERKMTVSRKIIDGVSKRFDFDRNEIKGMFTGLKKMIHTIAVETTS